MFIMILRMKKHWKPPYAVVRANLLNLFFLVTIMSVVQSQTTTSSGQEPVNSDALEIIVEPSPYSIKFTLNDTKNFELMYVTCKNENEKPNCENLNPCSTYLATLTINNLTDETTFNKSIEAVETTYNEPSVNIINVETNAEDIKIIWQATDRSCISTFTIRLQDKDKDKDFETSVENMESECHIKDLKPCQEYTIQLKAFNITKELITTLTTTSSTEYAEPGNVTVSIEEYENAQILVTWDQPEFKTCIKYYYLKWFIDGCSHNSTDLKVQSDSGETIEPNNPDTPDTPEEGVCEWYANVTDNYAKQYIISNLQGCEMYGFEIYINSDSDLKSELQSFVSPEQVPGSVTLETPIINSTNITLKWSSPKAHSKCVRHYQIMVEGPLARSVEKQKIFENITAETIFVFDELDPCGKYNCSIVAISLSGTAGYSSNFLFDTTEAIPTPVLNTKVDTEPHSFRISWEPPAFADLCITEYRLSGWKDQNVPDPTFDKTTSETSVQFENLFSCQSYTIQIIPVAGASNAIDGELRHIEAETTAIAAKMPNNLQATGLYPHSLELSAYDDDVNNNCDIIFARFICELSKQPPDVPNKSAMQDVEKGRVAILFKAQLTPLSAYTEYLCNVAFFNVAGWSNNASIVTKTAPFFPDPPEDVYAKTVSTESLIATWKVPKYANGNIKLYLSHLQRVEAAYYIPPKCSRIAVDPLSRTTDNFEQPFTALQPYVVYSIQVAAQNEYGVGEYTKPSMIITNPDISQPVQNLTALPEGPFETDTGEYKAKVLVSWMAPCKSNGEIESFRLKFTGERQNYSPLQFQRSVEPIFDDVGTIFYSESNLQPEYNYTVSVVVKTKDVDFTSEEVQGKFDAPAGIPQKLSENVVGQTRVNAFEADNPTSSAVVRLPADILESDSGTILYMALLLSQKSCNSEPELRYGAINSNQNWPTSPSWNDAYENNANCVHQYQTTPERWKPTNSVFPKEDEFEIRYIIGNGQREGIYLNGPLKADTDYYLVIRLFTKSGYNDAALLEFRTDSLIQLTLILVSVSCCLFLALVAGLIYIWITKRLMWKRESCHGIEDSFGDVLSKNFAIFYREVSKPEKISREFKELTMVAMDLSYAASEMGSNKNRYADIFPYDKNRVILDIDAEGSDYINASFIDGYRRKKEYIATQGPKPESTMDFWRMVLQHNVRIIVMVTQFREGNELKCHEYFPYTSKGINVTVKKRDSFEIFDRTEMSVTHDKYGLKQKVVHFYFKKWPDHGCPSDPMHLITFVRKVKVERVPAFSPIVVHCSAGVGRTGTFIALDIIMQRLRSESKINIYETVKKLRFQRMKMVQTLSQYTFLFTCTYELVKHKNTRSNHKHHNKNNNNSHANTNTSAINSKKVVSFEDDPELTIGTVPTKFHGRRNGSDVSSVEENEGMGKCNGKSKLVEAVVSAPIRFSGLRQDLESLDNRAADIGKTNIKNCNESAM